MKSKQIHLLIIQEINVEADLEAKEEVFLIVQGMTNLKLNIIIMVIMYIINLLVGKKTRGRRN